MTRKNTIFLVVGRLGENLVVSKTLPVISCGIFSDIYVFSEKRGIKISGVEYIILPDFIRRIKLNFFKKVVRLIFEPFQLIFYTWKIKPTVIHGFYSLPKGLNSLIASKLIKSKCVISIIGGKEEIETSLFIRRLSRPFIIWFLKKANYITTKGSKDIKYLLKYGVNKEKIVIFNGAIDTERFFYNGEVKDIDVLFAGYFDMFKGPQRALEIVRSISEKIPVIQVTFIGKGPLYQNILSDAKNLGLSQNIFFAGHVNDSEYYFKRAKILIFPSSNEGLSTAMLEAMACRCVPVTSDVGNQTEAAWHEYNSLVVSDFNNIKGFSESVVRLLNDSGLLNKLAENAERTILSKYTKEAQGKVCQRIYSKLIENEL